MTALFGIIIAAAPGILRAAATIALIVTSLNLVRRLCSNASLPSNLPWVGVGDHNSRLGRVKANLTSFFDLPRLLDEGYVKYSKNDEVFVLPYFINGPQVVLPPSQIPWLVAQTDDVLSQEDVNRQFLESDYSFFQANMVRHPVHPEIVQHELTRKLGGFVDDIVDEARAGLDEHWGTDTEEWREVRVYDTVLLVVARMTLRVLMGPALCRDRDFLFICSNFIRKVAVSAAAISLFPRFLKPVVGPIFTLFDFILYHRCRKFIMPIIRERLDRLRSQEAGGKLPSEDAILQADPGNDYVQWAIDHALAKPELIPAELDPRVIAARFCVLGFAAIQSSAITLTNALFDLAASRDCAASLASMHEEVVREIGSVGAGTGAGWSRAALGRMACVDSALRESLRLNGFIERGIMKMVVAPEGVVLPDGSRIPCGTKVGVSAYSVHHDEANYPDAMRFDALRFVRDQEDEAGGQKRPQRLINTSETFLGFSHGPHACPGRFFAANQLKIALSHIALLYDIEPVAERPVNKWFFGHIAPPLTNTLRVRRRKMKI
ncbi:cytochrome P450 [Nemania sp. NC0429]|nr:cytochrome P450 [Nemania sp. NC0429]